MTWIHNRDLLMVVLCWLLVAQLVVQVRINQLRSQQMNSLHVMLQALNVRLLILECAPPSEVKKAMEAMTKRKGDDNDAVTRRSR